VCRWRTPIRGRSYPWFMRRSPPSQMSAKVTMRSLGQWFSALKLDGLTLIKVKPSGPLQSAAWKISGESAMRRLMIAALALAVGGCETMGGYGAGSRLVPYDRDRPEASGQYDASRYYRESPRYRERALTPDDRVYRGSDGRYYCRRPDGTTGLVIGAIAGGVLGNIIAPGNSELLGTIIGAGVGAVIGQEIERGQVRCR